MLDLNLEADSTESSFCDETEPKTATGDDSGNSNIFSSTGATEEEYSNSSSRTDSFPTLNFSILNKNENIIEIEDEVANDHQGLVTHQLFPVDGEPSAASRPQQYWLNLAVPEPEGTAALGLYKPQTQPTPVKKSRRGPRSRSSQYRGVTFYRRTGRWESHIWDCGKQVYLGGFDTAHAAARAYDRAAIKFRGVDADINFHISDYEEDMKQTKNLTKEEFIQVLRRQSNGFARGNSKYRGITMHKCGPWEARMGQLLGKKAYDITALQCNGKEAVTNLVSSNYQAGIKMAARDGGRVTGSCEKLDLNLWVIPPSAATGAENPRHVHFQYAASELLDGKIVKVDSSSVAPTPHGLRMPSNYPPTWTTMYSGLTLNNEERSTGMKAEAIHPSGFPNRTWNVPNHGMVNPVPLFSSAASSGFPSTTVPYSTSLIQLIPNTMTRNPIFQLSPSPLNYNLKN